MDGSIAFWVALATAVAGVLDKTLSTWPKIVSLQRDVADIREKHKNCEEERTAIRKQFEEEWPSDPVKLVNLLQEMRAAGLKVTMSDVVRVLKYRKERTFQNEADIKAPENK